MIQLKAKSIDEILNDLKNNENDYYEAFLISQDYYLKSQQPPNSCFVNIYFTEGLKTWEAIIFFIQVFFQRHWRFTGQLRKNRDHLYYYLPLPPSWKYSESYMQVCILDGYLVFLTLFHVITSLLLDDFYFPLEVSTWLNVNYV